MIEFFRNGEQPYKKEFLKIIDWAGALDSKLVIDCIIALPHFRKY